MERSGRWRPSFRGVPLTVKSLKSYPDAPEVEEDGTTFFENALKKARAIAEYTGEVVIADDSGLSVDALSGAPGVYSARYAGAGATDEENVRKLLEDMRHVPEAERQAAFHCVIVLCEPGGAYQAFEGQWKGTIGDAPRGAGGFGYDPVFVVPGLGVTSAELTPEEKNRQSHRAQALNALKAYMAGR